MRHYKTKKILIGLTLLVMLICVSAPTTLAYMSDKTDTVKNTFVPVKTPEHDLNITVTGDKNLEGRNWAEGDAFSFEVQIWNGNEWEAIGTTSVIYDKEKEGFDKFDVSDIIKHQLTEPGKYSFRITEIEGVDENITYDKTTCRFDVVVAADETGAMDITSVTNAENTIVDKDDETDDYAAKVLFTNKYTEPAMPPEPPADPDDIHVDFVINKTVKNKGDKEIGPEGFEFKLVKDSTKEEWIKESDEEGYAVFRMTYTKDDIGKTFLYELSEINEGAKNVTYSDKVYDIKVSIELGENNKLIHNIKIDDKTVSEVNAEFINTYNSEGAATIEPTKPGDKPTDPTQSDKPDDKDHTSKTGDDTNILPVIIIMIVCLAGMAAVIAGARRRRS